MVNSTRRMSDQFGLRLPNGMRDRIAEVAEANNRSMNAEIVARLEASLVGTSSQAEDDFDPSGLRVPMTLAGKLSDQAHAIVRITNFMSSLDERLSSLEDAIKERG